MKIARADTGTGPCLGRVDDDGWHAWIDAPSIEQVLTMSPRDCAALGTRAPRPLDSLTLLAPLDPPSVRDFVAFERHMEGMVMLEKPGASVPTVWYEAPGFYFSNPGSLLGTGADVEIPPGCEAFDFELEVAAIVGAPGRDLTLADAAGHIAGYAILNDWSARDLQSFDRRIGMGWAKSKDTASTLGPWIVTADELESRRGGDGRLSLPMRVTRNGEPIGEDDLARAAWSFDQMLVYASRGTWLRTGDVIGSGTCASGCLAELWGRTGRREPRPLAAGDEVRMEVDGIGDITNHVVAGVTPAGFGSPHRLESRTATALS